MGKGISPVIALILLLLIVMALMGSSSVFLTSVVSSTGEQSVSSVEHIAEKLTTKFSITSVDKNKVIIRNTGTAAIAADELSFYVDGTPINTVGSDLAKGQVGVFTLDDSQLAMLPDPANLTIVSAGGFTQTKEADFYGRYNIGNWRFDEGNGTTAVDSSGNGNSGILVNMDDANWVDGKYGKALEFYGGDEHIEIIDNDFVDFDNEEFTISMWIRPVSNNKYVIQKNSSIYNGGYELRIDGSNNIIFEVTDSTNQYLFVDQMTPSSIFSNSHAEDQKWRDSNGVSTPGGQLLSWTYEDIPEGNITLTGLNPNLVYTLDLYCSCGYGCSGSGATMQWKREGGGYSGFRISPGGLRWFTLGSTTGRTTDNIYLDTPGTLSSGDRGMWLLRATTPDKSVSSSINLGQWSHITIVYDSNVLSLYINGAPAGSTNYVDMTAENTELFLISAPTSAFDGIIDEVKVLSTARSMDMS